MCGTHTHTSLLIKLLAVHYSPTTAHTRHYIERRERDAQHPLFAIKYLWQRRMLHYSSDLSSSLYYLPTSSPSTIWHTPQILANTFSSAPRAFVTPSSPPTPTNPSKCFGAVWQTTVRATKTTKERMQQRFAFFRTMGRGAACSPPPPLVLAICLFFVFKQVYTLFSTECWCAYKHWLVEWKIAHPSHFFLVLFYVSFFFFTI